MGEKIANLRTGFHAAQAAVLAFAGSNLRKLLRRLAAALVRWLNWEIVTPRPQLQ